MADFLILKDWKILAPLINQLDFKAVIYLINSGIVSEYFKQVVQPGDLLLSEVLGIHPLSEILGYNKYVIDWQPQGEGYFIRYLGGRAQYFKRDGAAVGAPLKNVLQVDWQPQGEGYFVIYFGDRAQYFNLDGAAVGVSLKNVRQISWCSQNADLYAVITNNIKIYLKIDSIEGKLLAKAILRHAKKMGNAENELDPLFLTPEQAELLPAWLIDDFEKNGVIDVLF